MKKYRLKMIDSNVIDYNHLTQIQDEVSELIIKNYNNNYLLKFETQLGKTRTAVKAIDGYQSPLIICPANLSKQWKEELKRQNVANFELVTINKLNMKDNAKTYPFKHHDIIVIDEFQSMLKSKTMKDLQKRKSLHLLGLSATPAGNDNLNYYQIAKTFFHKEPFVKGLTKDIYVNDFLVLDEKKSRELTYKGVKFSLPPTIPDKWKKDFESKLEGLIEVKRDLPESKVSIETIDYYSKSKNKEFTRYDGKKFFATSSGVASKLRRMQRLCYFDWNGSFENFKVKYFKPDFAEELKEMAQEKTMIVTMTPELTRAIAEFLEIPFVIAKTSQKERDEAFNSEHLVATIQTVGVGVASLHHFEKIVLIEPTDGKATIEQLKGRIMNNKEANLKLVIWK